MDNQAIFDNFINKSITTGSGGLMNYQQLQAFYQKLVETDPFLKEITVHTGIAQRLELDTIGIKRRAMRKGTSNVELTDTDNLNFGKRSLIPSEVYIMESIDYSFLMKGLTGNPDFNPNAKTELESLIESKLIELYARDVIDLAINGDEDAEAPTEDHEFLSSKSGFIKIASEDDDVVKPDAATPEDKLYDVMVNMLDALPAAHRANKDKLKFYLSINNDTKYRTQESVRATGKGDELRYGDTPVYVAGVKVRPLFAMPDNTIILTTPENLAVGFGTYMLAEREKSATKRKIFHVMTGHLDFNYADSEGLILQSIED